MIRYWLLRTYLQREDNVLYSEFARETLLFPIEATLLFEKDATFSEENISVYLVSILPHIAEIYNKAGI